MSNTSDVLTREQYVPILFWVVLLAIPIALIMGVCLVAIVRGVELIWETLPGTLFPGLDRRIYTVVVATLGGLLVGVVMRFLGHASHKTLQQELTEEGRVEYREHDTRSIGAGRAGGRGRVGDAAQADGRP